MTVHNTKLVLSNTTRTVITNSRKIATQSMQKKTHLQKLRWKMQCHFPETPATCHLG